MRRVWHLGPVARTLAAGLVAASLVMAMAAAAQAAPSQQASRAAQVAPESAEWIHLDGGCYIRSGWVRGWMSVNSNYYGTGYVNVYRRTSSGNVLVARAARSGRSFYIAATEPYQSGRSYFATWGFNSSGGSASEGMSCVRV
jgi:hypothetical protein